MITAPSLQSRCQSRLLVYHLRPDPPQPAPRRGRWGWITLFLLTGCLVFCHGCHGDEVDDELSVFFQPQLRSTTEIQNTESETNPHRD